VRQNLDNKARKESEHNKERKNTLRLREPHPFYPGAHQHTEIERATPILPRSTSTQVQASCYGIINHAEHELDTTVSLTVY